MRSGTHVNTNGIRNELSNSHTVFQQTDGCSCLSGIVGVQQPMGGSGCAHGACQRPSFVALNGDIDWEKGMRCSLT